jgi:hypothetical protein
MLARMRKLIIIALLLGGASPALAGADNFTLVNATGAALADLSIRRSETKEWKPLGPAPAPAAGARAPMKFKDPDCAFDIRAKLAGADAVAWTGFKLCDVKSVVRKHARGAGAWVDYDQ